MRAWCFQDVRQTLFLFVVAANPAFFERRNSALFRSPQIDVAFGHPGTHRFLPQGCLGECSDDLLVILPVWMEYREPGIDGDDNGPLATILVELTTSTFMTTLSLSVVMARPHFFYAAGQRRIHWNMGCIRTCEFFGLGVKDNSILVKRYTAQQLTADTASGVGGSKTQAWTPEQQRRPQNGNIT